MVGFAVIGGITGFFVRCGVDLLRMHRAAFRANGRKIRLREKAGDTDCIISVHNVSGLNRYAAVLLRTFGGEWKFAYLSEALFNHGAAAGYG